MRHVVLSPGSRSTPLTVAAADVEGLDFSIHLDERTAAFVALGRARVSGAPVGVVCTSGTAAANHLPAVAEAGQSGIPLVVITADRPPELQDWGAGQTFDQTRLFGTQVVDSIEMPVGGEAGVEHAVRAGWRAADTAVSHSGPVHVNWPFRLPLEPTGDPIPAVPQLGSRSDTAASLTAASAADAAALTSTPHGLIIAGPNTCHASLAGEREAVFELARRTGWPIAADVLSGLRGAPADVPVIDAADQLFTVRTLPEPDLILRLGETPTAKPLRLWWETLSGHHVLVDPLRRWQDPSHRFSHVIRTPVSALVSACVGQPDAVWRQRWVDLGASARSASDDVLATWPSFTEAHLARAVSHHVPADTPVVLSSSMPIRDFDSFAAATDARVVVSNRGINGIDGVVATASGVAGAHPEGRAVVLIGDVAVLHDVGSVLDAARTGVNLTLVVPNNDGGGIFSFLPIHDALDADRYRTLFHTPHGTTFGFLAGHPGIVHRTPEPADLGAALAESVGEPGVSIIEMPMDTPDAVRLHRASVAAVAQECQ